jgi:hypothetical protein
MQQKKARGQSAKDPRSDNSAEPRLFTLSKASKWVNDLQDGLSEAYLRAVRHCTRSYSTFDDTTGNGRGKLSRSGAGTGSPAPPGGIAKSFLGRKQMSPWCVCWVRQKVDAYAGAVSNRKTNCKTRF